MDEGEYRVDILDTAGQVIGSKKRKDIVKGHDIYHAVYVLLITPNKQMVLNKIAAREDMPNLHAGSYGCTAATIRRTNETSQQAADRAVLHHLKLHESPKLISEKMYDVDNTRRLVGLYYMRHPIPHDYNTEDIDELVSMDASQFEVQLQTKPETITPMLRVVYTEMKHSITK